MWSDRDVYEYDQHEDDACDCCFLDVADLVIVVTARGVQFVTEKTK